MYIYGEKINCKIRTLKNYVADSLSFPLILCIGALSSDGYEIHGYK